jgi:hypothetical protein
MMRPWFGPNGGLPKAPRRLTPRVQEALARYDRHAARPPWTTRPYTLEDRLNVLLLDYLITIMTPREQAAYYAGVQQRLKA